MVSDPIDELVTLLARLPGIGERTATRLALNLIESEPDYATSLGQAIADIHHRIRRCDVCQNYTTTTVCSICDDPRRDPASLCVVGRIPDLVAIERSRTFRGRYHVLHHLLAPLEGFGPDQLFTKPLLERVQQGSVREVILATPLSVEGEATALYLAQLLHPMGVSVSRIASGVPHGGELEFTDQVTLSRAFDGRRAI